MMHPIIKRLKQEIATAKRCKKTTSDPINRHRWDARAKMCAEVIKWMTQDE